ncbi:hypothetical protein JNUCC23_02015 [Peribacillus sp. JNUCC 23]
MAQGVVIGGLNGGKYRKGGYIRSSELGGEVANVKHLRTLGSDGSTARLKVSGKFIYHYNITTKLITKYDLSGAIISSFAIIPSNGTDVFDSFHFDKDGLLYSVYRIGGVSDRYTVDRYFLDGTRDVSFRFTYISPGESLRGVLVYEAIYFHFAAGRLVKYNLNGGLVYDSTSNGNDLLNGGAPETPNFLFFGINGNGAIVKMNKTTGTLTWSLSSASMGIASAYTRPLAYNKIKNELLIGNLNGGIYRANPESTSSGFILGDKTTGTSSLSLQDKRIGISGDGSKIFVPFGGYSGQNEGIHVMDSITLVKLFTHQVSTKVSYMGRSVDVLDYDDFVYVENNNLDLKIGSLQRQIL